MKDAENYMVYRDAIDFILKRYPSFSGLHFLEFGVGWTERFGVPLPALARD